MKLGSEVREGNYDDGEEEEPYLAEDDDQEGSQIGTRRTNVALRERSGFMRRLYPKINELPVSRKPAPSTLHSNFFSNINLDKIPENDGEMFHQAKRQLKKPKRIVRRPFRSEVREEDFQPKQIPTAKHNVIRIRRENSKRSLFEENRGPVRAGSEVTREKEVSEDTMRMTHSLENNNETPSSEKATPSEQSKII